MVKKNGVQNKCCKHAFYSNGDTDCRLEWDCCEAEKYMTTVTLQTTLTHEGKDWCCCFSFHQNLSSCLYMSSLSDWSFKTSCEDCNIILFVIFQTVLHWQLFSEDTFMKEGQKQKNINGLRWLMSLDKSKEEKDMEKYLSYS